MASMKYSGGQVLKGKLLFFLSVPVLFFFLLFHAAMNDATYTGKLFDEVVPMLVLPVVALTTILFALATRLVIRAKGFFRSYAFLAFAITLACLCYYFWFCSVVFPGIFMLMFI